LIEKSKFVLQYITLTATVENHNFKLLNLDLYYTLFLPQYAINANCNAGKALLFIVECCHFDKLTSLKTTFFCYNAAFTYCISIV